MLAGPGLRSRSSLFVVAACLSLTHAPTALGAQADRVPSGTWAGTSATLTVTDHGARVELDCSSGEVNVPLIVDPQGRFAASGTYVAQRGAEPAGGFERQPARYAGQLRGERIEFEISLLKDDARIGPFAVVLGAPPRTLRTCR